MREPQKLSLAQWVAAGIALAAIALGFTLGILVRFLWGALQIAVALFIFEVGIHFGYALVVPQWWITFAFAAVVKAYVDLCKLLSRDEGDEE